jgi:hypothetical protein
MKNKNEIDLKPSGRFAAIGATEAKYAALPKPSGRFAQLGGIEVKQPSDKGDAH